MLYEAWREIARQNHNELALVDICSRRQWTFAQLALEAEKTSSTGGPMIFPQGGSAEFIFAVLEAWRTGKVLCPLERGQDFPAFTDVPKDCIHLKATSGSTSQPQWIAFKAEQLRADAENIVATMGLRAEWPNLGVISLAHSYGFSNLVLPLLLHGIPLILCLAPLPETIRQTSQEFKKITLAAVPALWRAWHEADALTDAIHLAISAGAPLPLSLEQAVFEKCGLKIHNFYGASECGSIAYDSSDKPRSDDTAIGRPMANVELDFNAEGCLRVRSKAVGETYWPAAQPALAHGIFQTSDRAEIIDGAIFLRGRHSDIINLAGRKIAPETIERALLQHPSVRECVVFAVPDEDPLRGDSIVTCLSTKSAIEVETLKHFLLNSLPAWQLPRHWWFQDSIADSIRGKISRAKWRERFLQSHT